MSAKKATTKKPSAKQLAARRKFAAAAKARAKTATAKRNAVNIKAKRVTVLNVKRNPNYEILKKAKPVKKGSETGWQLGKQYFPKAKGQRKLPGGALLDLGSGFVYRKVENPKKTALTKTEEWEKAWTAYVKALSDMDKPLKGANARAASMRLAKARNKIQQLDPDFYMRVILKRNPKHKPAKKRKNIAGFMQDGVFHPIRSGIEQRTTKAGVRRVKSKKAYKPTKIGEKTTYSAKKAAKRAAQSKRITAETKTRKATTSRLASRSLQRSVPLKPARRNPNATEQARQQFKEFHGYAPGKSVQVYVPESAPTEGLSTLGEFYKFTFEGGGDVRPAGKVYLLRDLKGRLHLGGTQAGAVMTNEPAGLIGTIKRIEYIAAKPHLNEPNKIIWFHRAGEEGGAQPRLYSDGKGGLLVKGGDYYITPEGIRN